MEIIDYSVVKREILENTGKLTGGENILNS